MSRRTEHAGCRSAADARHGRGRGGGLPADGLQRPEQPRAAPARTPWPGCRRPSSELGYSPNRAARNLRTRSSHLVGLRVDPAVEDSANALMDRFVHSLVESTREAGYHVLLFTAATASDAARRLRRAAALRGRRRVRGHRHLPRQPARRLADAAAACRSWPSAGPGATRRRGTPGSTSTAAPGVVQAVDHLVERGHTPDRLGRLAEGLVHRRGPAQRLARPDARPRPARPAGCPRAATTPWSSARGPRTPCSTSPAPSGRPRSCAPATRVAMGVLRTLDELGLRPGPGRRAWSASTTRSPPRCHAGADLGAAAARAGRGRGGALPRPAARAPRRSRSLRLALVYADAARSARQLAASVAAPPEVDGVVDLGALVARRAPRRRPARRARCARTASRSARVGEPPDDVERPALPAVRGPEPLHLVGVDHRVAAPEPRRRTCCATVSLSIDERRAAAAHHPVELAQARLAAGAEEVRPPGLHDVDGRVGQRDLLRRTGQHRDVRQPRRTTGARPRRGPGAARRRARSARRAAQRGRWKPVPQPRSSTSRPAQPDPPRTSRIADSMTPSGSTARFSSS